MEDFNIPGIILMENAALKVIKNIDLEKFQSFVIVCGKGNNGGDGFAIARHLYVLGKEVKIYLVDSEGKLSNDCSVNYNILINMGLKINKVSNIEDLREMRNSINESHMVLDCIFGTGLKRNVEGIYKDVISIINENSNYTISVDVPSGINSDNGSILGTAIIANRTISFQLYKRGFLNYNSHKFTGEIIVENIGVPEEVVKTTCPNEFIVSQDFIKQSIKKRQKHFNKGDFGRALIISGSEGFTGAAYISTKAAVRSGAGLVTLACPKEIQNILSCKLSEAMTVNFQQNEKLDEIINKAKAIAIGPGMGNNSSTYSMVEKVLNKASCPVVLDADGINVLQHNKHILEKSNNTLILTPHPGEMSRITGKDVNYINENRIDVAEQFALQYGVILLLKGYNTVITDGHNTFINSTGHSAMANGGMGDCLTGLITSFIAQGYKPLEATYIAAYVHGYCGEKLAKNMFCVNAEHIIEHLPFAIKEIM